MKRLIIAIIIAITFVQCKKDQPTIDSQTEITFNTSFDEISKTLPSLQQEKFKEALFLLFEYDTKQATVEARWAQVRRLLDGKNAEEIFTMAEQVAQENGISWNRNQAPYPGGIPKMEKTEALATQEHVGLALDLSNVPNGVKIYPSLIDANGQTINNMDELVATVDVLSDNVLIHTQKFSIPPQSFDLMSAFDGFVLSYDKLDQHKITSNMLDILVRIPHPNRYLTLRKRIRISDQYVKETKAEANDSIAVQENVVVAKTNPIATKFVQNIVNGNLSGAYALSKIDKYDSYNDFANADAIKKLAKAKINSNVITQSNENRVEVNANISNTEGVSHDYSIVVEKIDNRWYVTRFQ
ncbi:hypothetical protein ACF3NR_06340 [Vaginella massiliensis]|uniref:hypothetical protein n=1 Tax=Vaginella massiliensis TaxID=1816680 RepID=UPI000839A23C|nr:hypothetical protein [Vaginella massiliensis]